MMMMMMTTIFFLTNNQTQKRIVRTNWEATVFTMAAESPSRTTRTCLPRKITFLQGVVLGMMIGTSVGFNILLGAASSDAIFGQSSAVDFQLEKEEEQQQQQQHVVDKHQSCDHPHKGATRLSNGEWGYVVDPTRVKELMKFRHVMSRGGGATAAAPLLAHSRTTHICITHSNGTTIVKDCMQPFHIKRRFQAVKSNALTLEVRFKPARNPL
jgi:hypothetical protein